MKKLVIILFLSVFISCSAEKYPVQSLKGFNDSGVFKLFVKDSEIGKTTFSFDSFGNYKRTFLLKMGGQSREDLFNIFVDNDGNWKKIEIISPTDTIIVNKKDNKAEYSVRKKNYSINLQNNAIIYDNYSPAFESFILRLYDMQKKGKQKFLRYFVPSSHDSVELDFKSRETRNILGKETGFNVFIMKIAGIELFLWADMENKVCMMHVPVQYATFIREGYEELMITKSGDSLLSKPEFDIEKKKIMMPMRDGIKLATDLYMPKDVKNKIPVILVRTPYKKEMSEMTGNFYSKRGYAVAIQDCRGRFGSEGIWEPFMNEKEDGYDAVEWLAKQDWCNSKVGMIGGSYLGWVQLWAASLKPPHLTTIIPNVAPPDPFYNFIFGSIWWAEILETEATGDLSGKAMGKIGERKYEQILKRLPVIDLDKEIFGKENTYWRKWIKNNINGGYWDKSNFMNQLAGLDIPVFLQSGWFDGDGIGSKLNYLELKKSKNKNIKLILGPWGHTDQSSTKLGDIDFGTEAGIDLQVQYLKWFDYWLKDIKNDILKEPLVQLFVMKSNKWAKGDIYPLPKTDFRKLYINCEKRANTSKGDGSLSWQLSSSGKEFDSYTYDPGNPTPWPSWYFKSEDEIKKDKEGIVNPEAEAKKQEEFHNKITDTRTDILVYQTQPFKESLSIAGPMSAVLYASSSAIDTDWFVTLSVVDTNGRILELTRGTIRARFRNSTYKPEFLEKNKVYEYKADLWQTGITVTKGQKIRIEISSALFPLFSRNLNTGGHNEMETNYIKAEQKIYHSKQYPSHILLPVIELK